MGFSGIIVSFPTSTLFCQQHQISSLAWAQSLGFSLDSLYCLCSLPTLFSCVTFPSILLPVIQTSPQEPGKTQ